MLPAESPKLCVLLIVLPVPVLETLVWLELADEYGLGAS